MSQSIRALQFWALTVLISVLGSNTTAQEQPEGRVILEVTGALGRTNADGAMRYDLAMLDALGSHQVITRTPWTDGDTVFEGVLLRDLMADVEANGTEADAIALNDYTVGIPLQDGEQYDVILALRADGRVLTVRNRGPVWIIYPWNDEPDLQNEVYYSRSIWQLKTLDVR
ncbi:MAG: molybdopterin-dependent oxidoreductase [Rhodobacter sp.]|nr:molybdopterin-dependent oxidoreductase [Rhodobacter sp.]